MRANLIQDPRGRGLIRMSLGTLVTSVAPLRGVLFVLFVSARSARRIISLPIYCLGVLHRLCYRLCRFFFFFSLLFFLLFFFSFQFLATGLWIICWKKPHKKLRIQPPKSPCSTSESAENCDLKNHGLG